MAAVAVSSAAMAQGTDSGAIGFGWNNSDGTKTIARTDGNVNFTATEDLGGGLKATVVGGVDLAERGAGVNGRNISLNLAGGFGSLTIANVNAANSTRLSGAGGTISLSKDIDDVYGDDVNINSIAYVSPAIMPGLTIGVGASGSAYEGESFSTPAAAKAAGIPTTASIDYSLNYSSGPAKFTLTHRPGDERSRVSGSYNFGVASVGFGYVPAFDKQTNDQMEYEVWAPMGAVTIGFQSAQRGTSEGTAYGLKYDLSKRTNIVISHGEINGKTYQRAKVVHSF